MKKLLVVVFTALGLLTACSSGPKIKPGSLVTIEYKGTFKDGSVFDTTEGKKPLTFLVGSGQVIPSFESQVVKISQGKSRKFTLKAKEAYGEPDPKKVVTLPRDQRFATVELKEGGVVFANNKQPDGRVVQTPMKVVKLSDSDVTLDYNHPLSGKDLTFEVKVLEVREPQAQPQAALPPVQVNVQEQQAAAQPAQQPQQQVATGN